MSKKFLIIGVLSCLIMFSGCNFFSRATQSETKVNTQTVDENQADQKPDDLNTAEQKAVEEETIVDENKPVDEVIILPETKIPDETKTPDVTKNTEVQPVTTVLKETPEILLAKCLTEKGTKLYTASTCPHCIKQKALFNDGVSFLPDTECAGKDGWAKVCLDAGVDAVPTWIFANREKLTGQTLLATLAEKSGCTYTNNL